MVHLQKKMALINDFTGYGRCSVAVMLPIISALKVQCCVLPTSILSNHTGFDSYFFDDYTEKMVPYMKEWKKRGLQFDGICSGFLGSKEQIQIVAQFFQEFRTKDTTILVDPVMGDHGRTYVTFTPELCAEMKRLVGYADILTPNVTEACILTDTVYQEKFPLREYRRMAEELCKKGPEKIVITGIRQGAFIANYCFEAGKEPRIVRAHEVGIPRSGTGDIFAAIIAADAVNHVPFPESVRKASGFVKRCIRRSSELHIPEKEGVCFEEVMGMLYERRKKRAKQE